MSSTNLGRAGQHYMPLWDTLTYAAEAALPNVLKFFIDPQSGTKPINRTNLEKPKEAPDGRFLVRAMRIVFGPRMAFADIAQICENYIARLYVGSLGIYQEGGIEYFGAGGGIHGVAAHATTATTTTITTASFQNGTPHQAAVALLPESFSVDIQEGQTFSVELQGTGFTLAAAASGGTGAWLRVYLQGIRQRQAQA